MTRDEIITAINDMALYADDYKTVSFLMANLEDSLFVKILEEILIGNLFFSDFERILSDNSYASVLENNLKAQNDLKTELDRLIAFRGSTNQSTTLLGMYPPGDANLRQFYELIKNEEIDSQIYSLFEINPSDNDVTRTLKVRMFEALQNGEIDKNDFLLFAREYILPISIEHQILNKGDLQFARKNNLSDDEVKKMKALSYFIRRLSYKGGE
jgi:hypothetical protein